MYWLILLWIPINCLTIFFVKAACSVDFLDDSNPKIGVDESSKMILWKVKYWSVTKLGWFYSKPICTCPTCMCLLHSTYIYPFIFVITPFTWQFAVLYIPYFMVVGGVNYFISKHD